MGITKQQFITIIKLIKQLSDKAELLNKFVNDVSESGYSSGAYLSEILILEELLQASLEPDIIDPSESLIDYFIYDLEFGTKPILHEMDFTNYIIDSNTDLSTPESLYDFLVNNYQNIEEENKNAEKRSVI